MCNHSIINPLSFPFFPLQLSGDFGAYYAHALKYLGCTDIASIKGVCKHNFTHLLTHSSTFTPSAEDKVSRALFLSLAALLAPTVYNFGELV
jgi:hypothetical protein